jgi:hypothetical protein
MRLYAVVCVLLTVGLLGREVLVRHEARAVMRESAAEALPAAAVPARELATTTTSLPALETAPSQPGLLTLFTLGAAVLGTVSTLSDGAALCASDACLAAHIVDKTAELHAVATDSLTADALARVGEAGPHSAR